MLAATSVLLRMMWDLYSVKRLPYLSHVCMHNCFNIGNSLELLTDLIAVRWELNLYMLFRWTSLFSTFNCLTLYRTVGITCITCVKINKLGILSTNEETWHFVHE
jgi:hypothetical protein